MINIFRIQKRILINSDTLSGRILRRVVSVGTAVVSFFSIGSSIDALAVAPNTSGKTLFPSVSQEDTLLSQEIDEKTSEVAPAPLGDGVDWYSLTDSEKEALINTIVKSLTSPTSTPLPEIKTQTVWDIIYEKENKELQPYRDEAREKGIKESAWNESCAKVVRAYDNSEEFLADDGIPKTKGENKWQANITRDEIFEAYFKKDETKFVLDTEDGPGIFLVQNKSVDEDNRAGKAFRNMVKWYQENGVPEYVDILNDNGMNLFCPIVFDERGPFVGRYDEYGGFYVNMTKDKLKNTPNNVLSNILRAFTYEESLGIAYTRFRLSYGMGVDWFMEEASKRILASEACEDVYKQTSLQSYHDMSVEFIGLAQDAADKVGLSLNDVKLQSNILFMKLKNIARSLSPEGWKLETASNEVVNN